MKVEVLCSINSGQNDNGDIVDIPDKQALKMLSDGRARKVGGATKLSEPKEPVKIIPQKPKSKKE